MNDIARTLPTSARVNRLCGSKFLPASRCRAAAAEQVGTGDDAALARGPDEDQVVVDHVVAGVLGGDFHAADDVAQVGAQVAHHDRAVPVGFRFGRAFLEQRVAQVAVGVEHQAGLTGAVGEDDPFPAGGVEAAQEGVVGGARIGWQRRPAIDYRQGDDAQGVDRLAFVVHGDVV
ncbi:MAG: hypothetical protein ACREUK_01970, partial [Burkholderiales bacterium]